VYITATVIILSCDGARVYITATVIILSCDGARNHTVM
jgi:hypothetical protein